MRTLIVDDSALNRSALNKLLAPLGQADVAADGNEALETFIKAYQENEPYEIVFLDISMPGMDGHQTLDELRKYEKSIGVAGLDAAKVIMTTSEKSSKHILGAFREGCEGYLVKPVTRESLYRLLLSINAIPPQHQSNPK